MSDLFEALAHPGNPRGHPLLAALAFAFCPAAAGWWMAGASPEVPPDPAREALRDMAAGGALREALIRRGLEAALAEIPRYVRAVEAFRRAHPGVPAPERSPLFPYDRLPLAKRFGLSDAVRPLGGWDGFYEYVRTWAFAAEDWIRGMGFRSPRVEAAELALALPGIRRPARFPAFVFSEGRRQAVGLLAREEGEDLRFPLAARADRADGRWDGPPEVWALLPDGAARPHQPWIPDGELPGLIRTLDRMAREGPWPPLRALRGREACRACGFQALCWPDGLLRSLPSREA